MLHQRGGSAVIAGVVEADAGPAADVVIIRREEDRIDRCALGDQAAQVARGLARVVARDVQRCSGQEAQLATGRQCEHGVSAAVDLRVGEHQVQRPVGDVEGGALGQVSRVQGTILDVATGSQAARREQAAAVHVQWPVRRFVEGYVLQGRYGGSACGDTPYRLLHHAVGDRGVGAVVIARIVETDPLPAAGKPVVRGKEHRIPGRALHYQPAPVGVVFGCEVGHVEQRPRQEAQLAACQDGQGWIVRAVDGHVAEDHFKGGPARLVNAAVRPDESGITGAVVRITSGADIARRNQVAGVQVQGPFTGLVELHLLERGRAGFRNRDTAHPLLNHAVLHQ